MKKTLLSILALATVFTTSCKKDNLQPTTTNGSTSIEQLNNQTLESEQETNENKVDARNKFIGTYTGSSYITTKYYGPSIPNNNFKIVITKQTGTKMKVVVKNLTINQTTVFYPKVTSNKLSFYSSGKVPFGQGFETVQFEGSKATSATKNMNFIYNQDSGYLNRCVILNAKKQ